MTQQIELTLKPKSRGFHLVTSEIMSQLPKIPITNGRLNMGTWQGIYLCEYRNFGGARKLVVTIIGE
jgi:thiamine phosphate synthase YjbQ (UPF0047 family)